MEIAYKKDGNENYMIIRGQRIDENDYKLQMIMNNHIDGIIPLTIKSINSVQEIHYKTTLMLSMENMFAKKGMSGEELFVLIRSIKKLFETMKEYLLDTNNIMFDVSNIFIRRQTGKYMFCYCPDYMGTIQDHLRNLFDRLLEYIDHNDRKAVLIAYEIQRITINDDFTIGDLQQCAEENIRAENKKEEKPAVKEDYEINKIIQENDEDETIGKNIIKKLMEKLKIRGRYKNERELETENTYDGDFYDYGCVAEEMEAYGEQCEDATMLLTSAGPVASITLRSLNLEQQLKITPNIFPCVLGNSKKSSDFLVNNPVVSRVHMRILEEAAGFYIEDLNSTNGTFVNDIRLSPHQPKEIMVGDKITLANVDFIVE